MIRLKYKLLVLWSYLFFVPALFIILSDKRQVPYLSRHAAQAFLFYLMLILFHVSFPGQRYNLTLNASLWGLIAAFGAATFLKEDLRIPKISDLAEAL